MSNEKYKHRQTTGRYKTREELEEAVLRLSDDTVFNRTYHQIASATGVSTATVERILGAAEVKKEAPVSRRELNEKLNRLWKIPELPEGVELWRYGITPTKTKKLGRE